MKLKLFLIVILLSIPAFCYSSEFTEKELNDVTNQICIETIKNYPAKFNSLKPEIQKQIKQIYENKNFQEFTMKPKIYNLLKTIPREDIYSRKMSKTSMDKFEKLGIELENDIVSIFVNLYK